MSRKISKAQQKTGVGANKLSVDELKTYIRKHGTGKLGTFSTKMTRPALGAFISNVLGLNLNRVTVDGPSAPRPATPVPTASNSNNSNYKHARQSARDFIKAHENKTNLRADKPYRQPREQKMAPATFYNRIMKGPTHSRAAGLKQLE